MIPKIIHLCWFGRQEFPPLVKLCINSWKEKLPNYKITIWTEDTFDVSSTNWTKEAYDCKKWAFVSDYVRLIVLYKYGGIYLDTDIEVVRDFSDLLENKKCVLSFIEGGLVSAGFIAVESKYEYIKNLLDYYENRHFLHSDGIIEQVMNPLIFTKIAIKFYNFKFGDKNYKKNGVEIYSLEFFMPYRKNNFSKDKYNHNKYTISKNTYTIHHDMGSWSVENKILRFIKAVIRFIVPQRVYLKIKECKNCNKIK